MSSSDGYDDRPSRGDGDPVPPPLGAAEPTRRIEPDAADATRRVDPADPPVTRAVDPQAPHDPHGPHDPTATRQLDAVTSGAARTGEPWEGTAEPYTASAPPYASEEEPADVAPEADQRPRRGRDVALVLIGSVLGFLLAFLVVAWGTSGRDAEVAEPDPAQQERIEALEAELEGRDAQIADLESQLAEAEAAAGDRDADIEAQRQALDERTVALDQRASSLEDRAAALDRREAELDQRETQLDEREAALDDAETVPPPDDGSDGTDGGIDLPEIDTGEVENVIERILERLRDLF
jgi:hypothetical protein